MELSLSGFLFEDAYRSQSLDLRQFCALARDCGYDAVELRRTQIALDSSPAQRRDVRTIVTEAGLRVTCLTARRLPTRGAARDDAFRQYLRLCTDLHCSLLKLAGEPDWLRRAADEARQAGILLATNNHIGGALQTVAGTLEHLRAVGHPSYGLLYDCSHLRRTGQDYVGAIDTLAGHTFNVLVQSIRPARGRRADHVQPADEWEHARIDDPQAQDWRAVFSRFRRNGYRGPVTVIENGWPLSQRAEVATVCARRVRALWEEAGHG